MEHQKLKNCGRIRPTRLLIRLLPIFVVGIALLLFLPESMATLNIWTAAPGIGDAPAHVGTGQNVSDFPATKAQIDRSQFPFRANDILIIAQQFDIPAPSPTRSRDYDCFDPNNQVHDHNFTVSEDTMHSGWPRWTCSAGGFLFFGTPAPVGYGGTPTWRAPDTNTGGVSVTFELYENDNAQALGGGSTGTRNDAPDPSLDAPGLIQDTINGPYVRAPLASCSVIRSGASVSAGCRSTLSPTLFDQTPWKEGTTSGTGDTTTGTAVYSGSHARAYGGGLKVEIQGGIESVNNYNGIPSGERNTDNWSIHQQFHLKRTWTGQSDKWWDGSNWVTTDPGWLDDGGGYWLNGDPDMEIDLADDIMYAGDLPCTGPTGYGPTMSNGDTVVQQHDFRTTVAYRPDEAPSGHWVDLTTAVSWGYTVTITKNQNGTMQTPTVTKY